MTDLAGPSRAIKVGQRPVKSCNICHRRKVRCDQQIPCSRCVARGIGELCKPETRIVKGRLVGETPTRRLAEPTYLELLEENKSLHRKIAAQQQVLDELRPDVGGTSVARARSQLGAEPRSPSANALPGMDAPGLSKRRRLSSGDEHHQSANGHGRDHAHGRHRAVGDGRDEHCGEEKLEILSSLAQLRGITDWHPSAQAVTPGDDPVLRQTIELIEPSVSSHLVRFHTSSLLWLHCTYHGPTFWAEHETWMMERMMGGRAERSYEYLAVYFAVISSSLFFMDEREASQLGIMPNVVPTLCKLWLGTAFHCLQASEYMTTPSMLALQAICIISLIGHHYGHTSYIASLYTLAIEHATRMGLHRLPKGGTGSGDAIKDELGRRIWTCLTVWESLDLGKFQAGLMYPYAETSPPTNVDDEELGRDPAKEHPGHAYHHTTQVSHLLAMGKLADMFRDLYFALRKTTSSRARYTLVREYADRFARHHLEEWPDLCPVGGAWLPGDPPPFSTSSSITTTEGESKPHVGTGAEAQVGDADFRPWSRFNWSMLLNGMRLSMYKPFLNLAYTQGGEWTEVREICLCLAQKILANRQAIPTRGIYHKAWPVISDTVLAGAIIASEMTYGHHSPEVTKDLRGQVEQCVEVLRTLSPAECSIAQRGVWLLGHMLQRSVPPLPLPLTQPEDALAPIETIDLLPSELPPATPAEPVGESFSSLDLTYSLDTTDFSAAASWLDEILGTDFDQLLS